jgi:hypothetical protein
MPKVIIPPPLRRYTDNRREVFVEADNLTAVLKHLYGVFPALTAFDGESALLSVFVNNRLVGAEEDRGNISGLGREDEITLIVPIAGG